MLIAMAIQYAQKISVSEKMIMHLPDAMDFETAAGIPEVRKDHPTFTIAIIYSP